MAQDIQELLKEGKEFTTLMKASENLSWPDSGTPSYIISEKWLDKYKLFVFHRELERGKTPNASASHLTDSHPGKINNSEILIQEPAYVKGTGKVKEFPIEVYDTFLRKDVRENSDYQFITEELWTFLKDRYGVDQEIKRFYSKSNTKFVFSTLTSVESRF